VYEGEFVSGAPERAAAIAPYRVLTPSGRVRLPMSLWGRVTAPVFNSLFRLWETSGPDSGEIQLFDSLFPFARRSHYLWMFGRRGLAEYQVLVPDAHADDFLASLRTQIIATRASAVLISMKLFRGTAKLLRFDGDGVCVTLNLTRSAAGLKFLSVVDDLTVAAGGVPNIVKDSRLPLSIVRACYPEYQDFRDRLHAYDPMRLFRSALSERLDL